MKRSLELEWHQEHLKEGRYNIHMGYIDKKIQEIVKDIVAKEFEDATRLTQQKDVKWEKDGFSESSRRKWITYEEVINDSRPIHYETVLGTRVASRAPEGGQI